MEALQRLLYPLLFVAGIILSGTMGYMLIEGWPWFDSLYMTVITLATIGYGEVKPLTPGGRWFTMGLIFVGVAVFGFLITRLTEAVIESG